MGRFAYTKMGLFASRIISVGQGLFDLFAEDILLFLSIIAMQHRKKGQAKLQETYSTLKIHGAELIKAVYIRGHDNAVSPRGLQITINFWLIPTILFHRIFDEEYTN